MIKQNPFNILSDRHVKRKRSIPSRHKVGKIPFSIQSILSYNLKEYGSRNNHTRRFTEIPNAIIGRSKGLLQQPVIPKSNG
jgi:hypothetical protein